MHKRIKQLFEVLSSQGFGDILGNDSLTFLKNYGATATEVAITLSLGFDIPEEEADKSVRVSNIFSVEDVNEIAYQTFMYF